MTDEQIVAAAKAAGQKTEFGELVRSPLVRGTFSAYEIGFIEGAEWAREQMPLPEDTLIFRKGVEEGRRLMMEDAVEGEVVKTNKHTSVRYKSYYGTDRYFYGIADKQFKAGDKVKIYIVKEDGQ